MDEPTYKQIRLKMGPDAGGLGWDSRFAITRADGAEFDRGQYLLHQGFYQEALGVVDSLADRFPEHPYIQNLLGAIFAQSDKTVAALGRFERALELSPPDCRDLRAQVLSNIGAARVKLGQLETAEKTLFEALEYDPREGGVFANLGLIRHRQQRYDEAIHFYDTAFHFALESPPLPNYAIGSLIGIMNCLQKLGNEGEALRILEIVKKLPPTHAYLFRETLNPTNRQTTFYNREQDRGK